MAADETLRVDPEALQTLATGLDGAAEHLIGRLAELDDQVGRLLGGWRGASGGAYRSAWELWHQGAREVHAGLSMLAHSVARAGGLYGDDEAVAADAMREVRRG